MVELAYLLYVVSGVTFCCLLVYCNNGNEKVDIAVRSALQEEQSIRLEDIADRDIKVLSRAIKQLTLYIEENISYLSVEEQHNVEQLGQRDLNEVLCCYLKLNEEDRTRQKTECINVLLRIQEILQIHEKKVNAHLLRQFERSLVRVSQREARD